MAKFTNKQLIDQAREEVDFCRERDELIPSQQTAIRLRLSEIALAALMAPTEPVYQYRIRNGYNGQVTEWQTIRRDQVDFVLKAQPHNAEFQIIAPPAPVVPVMYKGAELLKKDGLELIRDGVTKATELELMCMAESLLSAPAVPEGYALVPVEMTPSQMRAIQLRSEVGGYITSNLSGAYLLLAELWEVALAAAPKRLE